ncbi:MAG: diguanylate cyclase [Nitrospirales bacterium]
MFKLWSRNEKESTNAQVENDHSKEPEKSSGTTQSDSATTDQAPEVLAKVMRLLGRHSFDLDQREAKDIEKEFERWAQHVLFGASVTESNEAVTDGRRNWGGLNQFVNTHRRHEKKYVTESLGDLRDVLLAFTHTIGRAVIEDQETDRHMVDHIGGLKDASEASSAEDMKRALLSAVDGISQLMEERKERQQAHVETLGSKLQKVQAELGQARKEMELDPLTKLYNRAALDAQLENVSSLSFLAGSASCFVMVDIDHFKQVNDTHGHRAGDAILQQFADRLVSTFLRKSDFVARYGGEEMVVILQGDELNVCERIAERLLETIRSKPFEHEGAEIAITASVGLAELLPGEAVTSWVERADRALYQAKETGRDRVCMASSEAVLASS